MEEIPPKHEDDNNKNSRKTLPVAVNIRAGGLGIGGIVLLGGALVAASIVAFKTRRSSSKKNIKKKTSQSPETQPVDAPSDEALSMKEIQTENSQSLTPDKKHEMDSEDIINLVVVQDQENTCVDSAVECAEEDSCLEKDDDGGEEKKHLMLIDKENDEQVDANSSVSDEAVMSVEEYEVIEDDDHQETPMEDGCVNQVKVEDNLHDEIVLDNCEGDLSDHETGYTDQTVNELAVEEVEEEEEAAGLMNKEAQDKEIAQKVEERLIMEDEAAKIDQTDNSPTKLMSKDEIPLVESIIEDGVEDVAIKAKLGSGVSSSSKQEEPTPEAKITNHKVEETLVQVNVEMITNNELIKKDEIPHVESVKEDEDGVEDVTIKAELDSDEPTPEAKIGKKDGTPYVEYVKENEESEKDVTVNADLGSGVGFSSTLEEPTQETKISNHKIKEDQATWGKNHNDKHDAGVLKDKVFASEPWNPKLMALFVLISVCCLVVSLLLILILLAYRSRTTNVVKFRAEN